MTLWAVIPVKPLHRGKSRLAPVLSEEERFTLNRHLFEHTLLTLQSVPEVDRILVVSRDPQILAIARRHSALTVQESGSSDLNAAVQKAVRVAQRFTVQSVLILPADLPLINASDVKLITRHAEDSPLVAIVPDRHQTGTNALLINPIGLIRFSFGEGSFQLHCMAARQAGARLEIMHLPRLALDLDTPEDIEYLRKELKMQLVF